MTKFLKVSFAVATFATCFSASASSRPMQADGVLMASILLNEQIDGAKDLQDCIAKFKRLTYGVISGNVGSSGGKGEQNSTTVYLKGDAKSKAGSVVLSVTSEEGSLTCQITE